MVKTRHSAETGEDFQGGFLTLSGRRTNRNSYNEQDLNGFDVDTDSDTTVVIQYSPRRKTNRVRKKKSPIQQVDESFEDSPPRRKTRRSAVRYADSDHEEEKPSTSTMEQDGYEDQLSPGGRRSKRDPKPNLDEDFMYDGIRRSTRQRKQLYDTFNEHLIDKKLQITGRMGIAREEQEKPKRKKARLMDSLDTTEEAEQDALDMYSRVKRKRMQVKRDMYGIPIHDEDGKSSQDESESDSGSGEDDDDEEGDGDNGGEQEEEDQQISQSYYLREKRNKTKLFTIPIEPARPRSRNIFRENSPPKHRYKKSSYRSPARRNVKRKERRIIHGNSSTSSSSSSSSAGDSSDDERRFERRKAKSMTKARHRLLPMNLNPDDMTNGVLRDRTKIGSSLADVDPMSIDKSVSFDAVGGLGKHIRALKEMIVFPLMYPEVFERFKISPPRGVLFYGPPGTGKTLVARALANECSIGNRRVAFFMRKGADCLSKWVGESERQLRLLFDQAYQTRPSIIFFDEIDGLAPVRSSRQDQIHSSIVSTLLALMDGLDSRGEIVVIGATNRIDSIDPALRRPGRFDREFLFPLPSVEARKQIVEIHTKDWNPKLSPAFMSELAEKCVGYCGADVKALCTEAALQALRRRYPQIYTSEEKLQLDVSSINVNAKDFHLAMKNIVPTSQRSLVSPGRALTPVVKPLLQGMLDQVLDVLQRVFPSALSALASTDTPTQSSSIEDALDDLASDEDEDAPSIFESRKKGRQKKRGTNADDSAELHQGPYLTFSSAAYQYPSTHRPRLLLVGEKGQGHSSHVLPAVLHSMERLPVHVLNLPALFAVSAKTPEESCAQLFREARRSSPSIIYLPHVAQWWEVIGDTLRATFLTLLHDLEPTAPLLILATADKAHYHLPREVRELFDQYSGEVVYMQNPTDSERREFFKDLLLTQTTKLPSMKKQAAQNALEVLPVAPPPEPRKLTDAECKRLYDQEENTLRELRVFLRDLLNKLGRDRKFHIFSKPVDEEDVPDYYQIIANPMDLSTMMRNIDTHQYFTVGEFLAHIDLVAHNALEYNPATDAAGKAIRHRACALKDMANAIVKSDLDPDFESICEGIKESRKRRGEVPKAIPDYIHTRPVNRPNMHSLEDEVPVDYPSRYSRRIRGMESSPPASPLAMGPEGDNELREKTVVKQEQKTEKPKYKFIRVPVSSVTKQNKSDRLKSVWCKPRKRRYKRILIREDTDITEEECTEEEEEKEEGATKEGEAAEKSEEPKNNENKDPNKVADPNISGIATIEEELQPTRTAATAKLMEVAGLVDPTATSNDSGIGSAPDSNGESMDRDLRKESKDELPNDAVVNTSTPLPKEKKGEENQAEKEDSQAEESNSPTFRMTRAQAHNMQVQKARAILEESMPKLVIDEDRLRGLLENIVVKTRSFKVEQLEKLHCLLSQCIYHHRKEYNKTQLVQELESSVEKLTQRH